jgi:hypothetical protein
MKNLYFTFLAFLLSVGGLTAQAEIVATVMDSTGMTLPGANAVLLRTADSLLTSFGTTDNDGIFRMQNVPPGNYLLRVTFLGYERPDQTLDITADDQYFGLGDIKMYPAGFFLNGVEVTADRIPIRMKGDTMMYDAEAFAVGENAVVEDLIRRLPGMSVDASGAITWRGRPISEVMINGKPFFAGNSTLLTQNLDAKAITKVEVFDQKTDAEEISGVDDGTENMTVNLEMKDEFKAKVFGEVYAGYGTNDRYQAGGKLFRISDASQIGILSTVNNVNKVGFSGDEISGFNGSSGRGRSFGFGGQGDLPFDSGNATGQNRSIATGINFGRSVGKNGQLTADYALFDRQQTQVSTTLQAFNRANDKRIVETMEGSGTGQYSHRLGFEFRQKLDSTARLTVEGAAFLSGGDNDTRAFTNIRNDGTLVEEYNVQEFNNAERPGGNISLEYNRGGGNGRRSWGGSDEGGARTTYSLEANASREENRTDLDLLTEGLNETSTGFIGALINGQQAQNRRTTSTTAGLNANVTKPFSDNWRVRVGGEYNIDLDQGDYRFQLEEQAAVNLQDRSWNTGAGEVSLIRTIGKGGNLTFGTKGETNQLKLEGDEVRDDRFNYLLPFVRLRKRLKKGFLNLSYNSSSNAPSIAQLQTIVEPNASGRAAVGNPELNPAVNHRLNSFIWLNDQFRAISANGNFSATYTDNAFGNSVTFTEGQQIFKPVNVSHAWTGNAFLGTTIGINAISGEFRFEGGVNYSRGEGFVDDVSQINTTLNSNIGANITTEFNEDSFLKIGYTLNDFRNAFVGEADGASDINQRTHDLLAQFELEVSPKWRFESRFLYSIFAKSDFAEATNIPDLRLSLELRPFRKKGHFFRISASDVFDQNTIINRRVSSFVTTETTSDGLGFYMLGTFHFKI